jgi:putative PIN family toxin of toxin-antitoxin system
MGPFQVKRVVVDSNVVVSALLFGGISGKLIPLWKGGRMQPLCSKEIIDEYVRVLAYPKFRLVESEIEFLVSQEIVRWFEIVTVPPGEPFVISDPSDDKFIWCALEGRADAIISGDEHLLNLAASPIPILTPSGFLTEHETKQASP